MKRLGIVILAALTAISFSPLKSQDISRDHSGAGIRGGKSKSTQSIVKPATDAGYEWQTIGPFGGDVVDIAIDAQSPDTIYSTAGIPYISTDGGDSWTILNSLFDLAGGGISSIEISNSGTIFAAGEYIFGKVYRSMDDGTSWQQFVFPVNSPVLDIVTDPVDDQVVYCAVASLMGSAYNKVIMKSVNGGQNWGALDLTSVLPVGYSVVDIAVDPGNNQTIFAIGLEGFSNCLVVASFDGGTTWEIRSTGLPTGKPYNALTIVDNTVYMAGGQLFGSQNLGVYKSADYGLSWQNISASFPNKVTNEIVYNPFDHNYLYAGSEGDGVYISSDGGTTWIYNTQGDGDKAAVRKIVVHPGDPMQIYSGMLSLAVGKSNNGGNSWAFSNYGIATLLINQIEVDTYEPQTFLASFEAENSGGCFLTSDGGLTWELVSGLPGTRFSAVDIASDGTMYAWSNGPSSIAQEGLYKSTDGGLNWTNTGPNIGSLFETEVFSVCVSPANPSLIFIGGNNFGANGWESMIYRSTDAGSSWSNVYMGAVYDGFRFINIVPGTNDQVVYASYKSQDYQGGFLKSTDGGLNWAEINTGIPAACKWGGSIIAVSGEPDMVFAGAGGAGDIPGTVYRSEDGGLSWTGTDLSLGTYSRINDLLINPQNDSVLYAASGQDGVYISLDFGQTWEAANDGLPAISISSFSKPFEDEGFHKVLCSTTSNSAFSTLLYSPGFTSLDESGEIGMDLEFYPVPLKDNLIIQITAETASWVRVFIYNLSGSYNRPLFEGRLPAGTQTLSIDFSEVPDGSYILEIKLNDTRAVRKIIVE